jgi:hypothetical protein
MLAMSRLPGSAAAFIAALASYRPMPNPPAAQARADRFERPSGVRRREAEATLRPDRPRRKV